MTYVTSPINWILRTEGLVVLILALYAYFSMGVSWVIFAIFFLLPDISLIGYLAGNKIGASAYNIAHSYIGALICAAVGFFSSIEAAQLAGIIWVAHIGFDRTLGYGLKYTDGFRYTHLGAIGKERDT